MTMSYSDVNEFIVVSDKTKSIPVVLKSYEKYGGLALNRKTFGSSGHVSRPAGGVLPSYSKCYSDVHVTRIVSTQRVKEPCSTPNCFLYHDGYFAVDTSHAEVGGVVNPGRYNMTCAAPLL